MSDAGMSPLQVKLWKFLSERFVGIENATRRETILARFKLINKIELSDRDFRDEVSVLVTVFKKAICTVPSRGYYVARTESEKDPAIHYLDSVLTEIGDRRRALVEADPMERQERLFR